MKILYLNVNGFFGNSNIKEIQKKIKILRANQKNGCYPNCSKKIANELKEEKEEFDFILLSEIDPGSDVTNAFVESESFTKYELLLPWGKKLSDLKGSSCTICLKKKGACETFSVK